MIIAVVEIPPNPAIATREATIEQALASTTLYHDVDGLIRKHYIRGDNGGGGIYLFESREKAEAWFHDGWADWMEGHDAIQIADLTGHKTLAMVQRYSHLNPRSRARNAESALVAMGLTESCG